jgi:hypothetical protein
MVQEFEEVSDVEGESPRVACSPNTDPVGHGSNARLSEMLGPAPPEVAFDAPSLPEDVAPLSAGASTYTPDPEATMTELVGFSRVGSMVKVLPDWIGSLRVVEGNCVSCVGLDVNRRGALSVQILFDAGVGLRHGQKSLSNIPGIGRVWVGSPKAVRECFLLHPEVYDLEFSPPTKTTVQQNVWKRYGIATRARGPKVLDDGIG